eukprot:44225-Eustigmatos_ZCMA.PRE.1
MAGQEPCTMHKEGTCHALHTPCNCDHDKAEAETAHNRNLLSLTFEAAKAAPVPCEHYRSLHIHL